MVFLCLTAITLLAALFLPAQAANYVNNYDKPFTFSCSGKSFINSVESRHSNHYEDRQFAFGCASTGDSAAEENCNWSIYQNTYDEELDFDCSNNEVMTGVDSIHSNHKEDRQFKFHCCGFAGYTTQNCNTTGYVNEYDASFRYDVPAGMAISGVYSIHDNHKEDRRFKFKICDFSNANTDPVAG